MTGQAAANSDSERVFLAKTGISLRAAGSLGLGLLLIGAAVALMAVTARTPATPERSFAPGLNARFMGILMPSILGCFLILRGVAVFRMARLVVLSAEGIRVEAFLSRQIVPWGEVRSVDHTTRSLASMFESIPVLEILDAAGRKRAVITDSVQGFDELAQEIAARSSAYAGRPTDVPAETEARRVAKATRQIRWAAWAFLVLTLGMGAAFVGGLNEEWHVRRYASEGVEVEATVLRTWMVRVTRYVEYSFSDPSGEVVTRQAMMFQGADWERVQKGKTIPVVYLRSAPEWNRLARGEDRGPQFGSFLFVTGGGIVMFGLLSIASMKGYDLKVENGVTTLLRHGRVVREWKR